MKTGLGRGGFGVSLWLSASGFSGELTTVSEVSILSSSTFSAEFPTVFYDSDSVLLKADGRLITARGRAGFAGAASGVTSVSGLISAGAFMAAGVSAGLSVSGISETGLLSSESAGFLITPRGLKTGRAGFGAAVSSAGLLSGISALGFESRIGVTSDGVSGLAVSETEAAGRETAALRPAGRAGAVEVLSEVSAVTTGFGTSASQ